MSVLAVAKPLAGSAHSLNIIKSTAQEVFMNAGSVDKTFNKAVIFSNMRKFIPHQNTNVHLPNFRDFQ